MVVKHERLEKPIYSIPDRHAEGGRGDRPDGSLVHGSDKQAWVEKDPILPDPAIDGKKDVG